MGSIKTLTGERKRVEMNPESNTGEFPNFLPGHSYAIRYLLSGRRLSYRRRAKRASERNKQEALTVSCATRDPWCLGARPASGL